MVETAIFSQWLHREFNLPVYARWSSGEIDMVGLSPKDFKPLWCVEIKWSNKAVDSYSEIKNLLSFSTKNKLTDAFVTTLDASPEKEIGGVNINFVPSAEYAYNVGNNTIAHQYSKLQ